MNIEATLGRYKSENFLESFRGKALLFSIIDVLLSLYAVRYDISSTNIIPLSIFLLAFLLTSYYIYKGKIVAMVIYLIYISADTAVQIFILNRTPFLPILFWFLIAINLWNAILLEHALKQKSI